MAIAGLNFVKRDLEDGVRLHFKIASVLANGRAQKVIRQFGDFSIGQSAVGFADGPQFTSSFIANGESIIAENFVAFAMAIFGANDNTRSEEHTSELQSHSFISY